MRRQSEPMTVVAIAIVIVFFIIIAAFAVVFLSSRAKASHGPVLETVVYASHVPVHRLGVQPKYMYSPRPVSPFAKQNPPIKYLYTWPELNKRAKYFSEIQALIDEAYGRVKVAMEKRPPPATPEQVTKRWEVAALIAGILAVGFALFYQRWKVLGKS